MSVEGYLPVCSASSRAKAVGSRSAGDHGLKSHRSTKLVDEAAQLASSYRASAIASDVGAETSDNGSLGRPP